MSLPVLTNPLEMSAFQRRAQRLVDTVSDLMRQGPHRYAAFQARVDANRAASDNGWDHSVDIFLRQVLARDHPLYNAPAIQVQFAAGTVPFGYTCSTDYCNVCKTISGSSRMRSAGGN